MRRLREEVDPEAQQAVRAELQHHPGEDDRAGGGRLGVGVGQPGVQREDRHLHRERDREREEQPATGGGGEVGLLGDLDEVERDRRRRRVAARNTVAMMPTSMNAEPNIVNRKNFVAA